MDPIYLDYNATTPVDPRVREEMIPYLDAVFGNPSSAHEYGIRAKEAVMLARRRLANLLHSFPDEIVFTSGGTEANNLAIKGVAFAHAGRGNHVITSVIEHPAVTEVCRFLEGEGFEVTWIGVDPFGVIDPEDIRKAIRPQTILITIMHANNEMGTIQPVPEISRLARDAGVLFHTDAAQSPGKIPVDVGTLGVDLLSVAGHKVYAPKGIGALYVRRGVNLAKRIHGADHEFDRRAGTENVPGIVGLGKAAEIVAGARGFRGTGAQGLKGTKAQGYEGVDLDHRRESLGDEMQVLRDRLHQGIMEGIPEVRLNGHPDLRLPNTLSLGFPGVEANRLLLAMKGIAASAGAACHAGTEGISGVLSAMHVPAEYAMGTIRFSVGRMTTEKEIWSAIPIIVNAYHEVKRTSGRADKRTSGRADERASGIRLTEYSHSLGCACKVPARTLEKILHQLPSSYDPHVLVGTETLDDATVFQINDSQALVQTVDVIPPIVDDPFHFGAIAAANALSDIYAMGGKPLFALNIVGFPGRWLPLEAMQAILRGANEKAAEAGIEILGGHTMETSELLFGLTVTGIVHPTRFVRNRGLQPGDALILTKPLGTGVLATALKTGLLKEPATTELLNSMLRLNRDAAEVMQEVEIHACTDITGFGLLGHIREMIGEDPVDVELLTGSIPVFSAVWELLAEGILPGGTNTNLEVVGARVIWDECISVPEKMVLCDAQTSGGLLMAVSGQVTETLLPRLIAAGFTDACRIGKCLPGTGKMMILK